MENKPESSHGKAIVKKSRLDAKSLCKSWNLKEAGKNKLKRKGSAEECDEKSKSKKNKSRKELSISSIKDVNSNSKSRLDEVSRGGCLSSAGSQDSESVLSQKLNGSSGLKSVSHALKDSIICIPKRKRDFVGRKKVECKQVVKPDGELSSKLGQVDQVSRLISDELDAQVDLSKVKPKKVFDDFKENIKSESNSAQHLKDEDGCAGNSDVNNGDLSLQKLRRNRRRKKVLAPDTKPSAKEADPLVETSSIKLCDNPLEDDEENLEENAARMLSSRFDPSCTGFSANSKSSTSPSMNGLSFLLSTGQDFGSIGFKSLSGSKSASVDSAGRVLRPRKEHKEKGHSRKRRHFYEFFYGDLDAYWVLNQRIKIFWPLDQSWYFGFVNDYDEERKLHHVKYDDRDEEWINLQNERFKLLLFPSEVPGKDELKKSRTIDRSSKDGSFKQSKGKEKKDLTADDDSHTSSYMDSEPIISWLVRSTRRTKSAHPYDAKKQKKSSLSPNSPCTMSDEAFNAHGSSGAGSLGMVDSTISSYSELLADLRKRQKSAWESTTCAKDNRHPIVYVRRRFRKTGEVLDITSKNSHVSRSALKPVTSFSPVADGLETREEHDISLRRLNADVCLGCTDYEGLPKLTIPSVQFKQLRFDFSFSLLSVLKCSFEAENLWLCRAVMLLQYGVVMTIWPMIHLELLFVDNVVGVRFVLFEGCLKQAVALVFLVMTVFHQPNEQGKYLDLRLPVTSVWFKFSLVQDGRKHLMFPLYNFCELRNSDWAYINYELASHCLLTKQLPLSECSDNIRAFQSGITQSFTTAVPRKYHSAKLLGLSKDASCNGVLSGAKSELRNGDLAVCGNSDRIEPIQKYQNGVVVAGASVSTQGPGENGNDVAVQLQGKILESESEQCYLLQKSAGAELHRAQPYTDLAWHINDGIIPSPNPTAPRSTWHRNRNNSSSTFGYHAHGWSDGNFDLRRNGFGNGPKKPRTQVSYALPYQGFDFSSKHRSRSQRGPSRKRIRRASEKRPSDASRGSERNFEFLSCNANVLITSGDKGWRECGVHVILELVDHSEWRLAVKHSGTTKFSYSAHQFLQPGSTNRYTHAMMWRGGKDWVLEFPDRNQWVLFKEMHEECYNRNLRATLVKNIPIPGVRLVEENDDSLTGVTFVRSSSNYFRQVLTDVEMALDPLCVLYDMDSDDEKWIMEKRVSSGIETSSTVDVSDEMFEKMMDIFEKAAYIQQSDQFTLDEIEELMTGFGSSEVITSIYEHWQQKRQKKGMPLIRHLQPPLWERYQQQVKEWEMAMTKTNSTVPNGCQEKAAPAEKPPVFAFCLKPRGLEVPNRGSKQRSHRKISATEQSNTLLDQDGFHSFGRRLNGFSLGDEKVMYPGHNYDSLDDSPLPLTSPKLFSSRDGGSMGYFWTGNDGFDRNYQLKLHRNKSKKFGTSTSPNDSQLVASYNHRSISKRNGVHQWNMRLPEWPNQRYYQPEGSQRHAIEQLDGSDLDEFKLRDASGAAQHVVNMAKRKREKAQRLHDRAELAIHKAAVALMTAEAIKASTEDSNGNG